jgi:hypothetical protein
MAEPPAKDRVDPELTRQMNEAGADEPVGAVIRLCPTSPGSLVPSPEETERIAHDLLARVARHVKDHKPDFNVFRNLGYFVVSAPPAYLKALVESPEVAHAFPNRRGEAAAAPPEKK